MTDTFVLRQIMGVVMMVLLVLVTPTTLAAELPYGGELKFDVFLGDDPLGTHSIRFSRDGDDVVADIDIQLEAYLAFIRVFRYAHQNREVWRDGRLVSLTSVTDDNGQSYRVEARSMDGGLRVTGSGGDFVAPADTPSTSWWNYAALRQTEMLNSQRGGLEPIRTSFIGRERVRFGARDIDARRYRVEGPVNLNIWYDDKDEWVAMDFTRRGNFVRYVRVPHERAEAGR